MYDTVQVCEGCEGILYVECWSPRPSSFSSVIFSISKIEEDLLLPLYARFIRANRQVMRKPSIFCSLPFLGKKPSNRTTDNNGQAEEHKEHHYVYSTPSFIHHNNRDEMPRSQGTSRKGKPKKADRAAGMGRSLQR